MKKIGLGIAIILFGILVELSTPDYLYYFSWIIGVVGLILVIAGCVNNKDDSKK